LVTNHFFLVKGAKETLQDKKASSTKKSFAGMKGLVDEVPAGIHYGDVRRWGEGVQPGWEKVHHAGGLSYTG